MKYNIFFLFYFINVESFNKNRIFKNNKNKCVIRYDYDYDYDENFMDGEDAPDFIKKKIKNIENNIESKANEENKKNEDNKANEDNQKIQKKKNYNSYYKKNKDI